MAKSASAFARGVGNALGWITTGYSLYNFWENPNWEDGIGSATGIASYFYWHVGIASTYVNIAIDYRDIQQQNTQTEVDVIEGNGQFKGLSFLGKIGWILMLGCGSLTGPTGGY